MNLKTRIRGNVLAIIAILVVILGVVAYLLLKQGKGSSPSSAFEVAQHIPANVVYASAWQLDGQIDVNSWIEDLRQLVPAVTTEYKESFEEFEAELGMSAEEFAALFNKAGFLAVLDSVSKDEPGLVWAVGLADAPKFESWWQTQSESYSRKPEIVEIDGHKLKHWSEGGYVGHDDSWVFGASDEKAAKLLLSSLPGSSKNLASDARFQEGLSLLDHKASAGFFYLETEKLFNTLQNSDVPIGDKRMWKELTPIKYIVGSADFVDMQIDGYLRVEGESNLAKALLTPGNLNPEFAQNLSSEVATYTSMDCKWLWDSVLATLAAFPETRSYAGMAPAALLAYNPFTAMTGEVILANDMSSVKGMYGNPDTNRFQDFGLLIAPIKDRDLTHQLIVKAMPQASELTPKDGEDLTYPTPPGVKLEFKGTTKPQALVASAPGAEKFWETSGGKLSDNKSFQKSRDWGGDKAIYLDYLDLKTAFENLMKAADEEGSEESKTLKAGVERLQTHMTTFEGSSCLRAEDKGLHFRGHGSSNSAVIFGGGVAAAILVPNFIRARGQGQLTACKSNQKNIATACEMWSTDNNGRYPKNLDQLTPNYLKYIPECPKAGKPTYNFTSTTAPDGYALFCEGSHHADVGIPADYPKYNSVEGLIER